MEKTALVICILRYYDIQLDRYVLRAEEHIVSLKRCKELIDNNVCELIEIK
jgi:hypothetical protein